MKKTQEGIFYIIRLIETGFQKKIDVTRAKLSLSPKEIVLFLLDPGVRKFLVGYDPRGESIFIGEDSHVELTKLLVEIDKTEISKDMSILWRKAKNLVSEFCTVGA